LVALIISGIAGLTLASYLILAQQQNTSIYRSQSWNASMAIAEAGIEDGLQMINTYAGSFDPGDIYKWTNVAPGSAWTRLSPTVWYAHRTITDGSASVATNSYEVWIYNTNNNPTVYAEGTVPWTYQMVSVTPPVVAQAGSTATLLRPASITRKVLVNTKFEPLFIVAMAAVNTIDLNGKNIRSDSFDSADPRYSTNHFYPRGHPEMTKDNGDICTDAGIVDSLNIGNAHLRGHVRTGPGTNTFGIQDGSVGTQAWVDSNTIGIQDGYSATDFNVAFNDVKIPKAPPTWMPIGVSKYSDNGTNYDYHISKGGRYIISGLTGGVLVDAPTNEVVELMIGPDDVKLSGNTAIRIAPTGCKLYIYMWGASFSLSGNAGIDNASGIAANFYLYGTPSCTQITFGGNASFTGAIYAPSADFALGGGGQDSYDFVGASVTRTVKMNGHFNFHYDEDLAKVGPGQGYIPVGWVEL